MVGEACGNDEECCSRACRDDGTGYKSCRYLGGCRPFGELCRDDADCCNDAVDSADGTCEIFNPTTGVGRCTNPPACAPAGEVCEGGTNECCPGNPDGKEFCLTTAIGVDRCFVSELMCATEGSNCSDPSDCCSGVCEDGMCGALVCIADEQPCAFSDQCCSGICAPDSVTGELVCSPACLPDGESCTADGDCCNGFCDPQTLICGIIVQ